jgi:CRISP-associated protein Cas1
MIRKILEITQDGVYLSKSRGFIIASRNKEKLFSIPLKDIATIILNSHGVVLTTCVINTCSESGIPIIICGNTYKPESIILPLVNPNYESSGRIYDQINIKEPLRKQLWKSIIQNKINNQALVLEALGKTKKLKLISSISKSVLSGDTTNREAYAAKVYWKELFGKDFKRDPDLPGINTFLNYGYGVLRGIVARGVSLTGLHLGLGIYHSNRKNPLCLVDDLLEPFRPLFDLASASIYNSNNSVLTPDLKRKIIQYSWMDLETDHGKTPLIKAIEYYCYSLAESYNNKTNQLCFPKLQKIKKINLSLS